MAVVRREGDWRLEKRDDGVYEVTYESQPEVKIITSDYSPDALVDERQDFSVQVREVESFSGVEAEFEEIAAGRRTRSGFRMGFSGSGGGAGRGTGFDSFDGGGNLRDAPTGLLLLGSLFVGSFLIYQDGFNPDSPVFAFAVTLLTVGVSGLGWTYLIYRQEGTITATEFLVSTDNDGVSQAPNDDGTEKTPPAPEKLKNELYFERADQACEWCGDPTDTPEVHHIEPRSEGGPNEPRNLIVLCPGCHSKADRGTPSKTELKHDVERLEKANA